MLDYKVVHTSRGFIVEVYGMVLSGHTTKEYALAAIKFYEKDNANRN